MTVPNTVGLKYTTDFSVEPGLPVNIPYFWKFLLAVPSKESGFVDSGNKLLNDLFHDITNYFLDRDIRTCNMFQKHLYRLVSFRYYNDFNSLEDWKKEELKENGFIYPSDGSTPGIEYQYNFVDNIPRTIGVFADSFYKPKTEIRIDVNFELNSNGNMNFLFNPVEGDDSFIWTRTSYNTSWGDTINIMQCNLIAMNIELYESPLWENYGCLVYSREYDETLETEQEYRQKIVGLFLLYYNGMKINVLNAAVNTMLGLPVFLYEHEIIKDIIGNEIITDKTTYTYDSTLPLKDNIVIGARVRQFDTIHNIVEIKDSYIDPDWVNGKRIPDFLFLTPENDNMNSNIDTVTTQDLKVRKGPFLMEVIGTLTGVNITHLVFSGITLNNTDDKQLYYSLTYDYDLEHLLTIKFYKDSSGDDEYLVAEGSGKVKPSNIGIIPIVEKNSSGLFGEFKLEGPTTNINNIVNPIQYFRHVSDFDDTIDLHFDLYNIRPEYVSGQMYPIAKTNNYYIWEKYFKTILFNIKILVNYFTFEQIEEIGIMDEVLPLNVYYLKDFEADFSEYIDFSDSITEVVDVVSSEVESSVTLSNVENFRQGDILNLEWESYGIESIDLSYNDGSTDHTIVTGLNPNNLSYEWDTVGVLRGTISITITGHRSGATTSSIQNSISVYGVTGVLVLGGFVEAGSGTIVNGLALWDPDTATWSAYGDPHTMEYRSSGSYYANYCMTQHPITKDIYVAAPFTDIDGNPSKIAYYDGVSWRAPGDINVITFDNPYGHNEIDCMKIDKDGNLYVGGSFGDLLSVSDNIVKFNGTSWVHIDDDYKISFNYTDTSVRWIDFDNDGKLWISGRFDSLSHLASPFVDINAFGLASYDSVNGWKGLGVSTFSESPVYSIFNKEGYIVNITSADTFTSTKYVYISAENTGDASTRTHVALYLSSMNGKSLAPSHESDRFYLGSTTPEGPLYVDSSTVPASYEETGVGITNGSIDVLKSSSNNRFIYAGGTFFSDKDGNKLNRIAMWDGTSWNDLGGGLQATDTLIAHAVKDILILEDGDPYVKIQDIDYLIVGETKTLCIDTFDITDVTITYNNEGATTTIASNFYPYQKAVPYTFSGIELGESIADITIEGIGSDLNTYTDSIGPITIYGAILDDVADFPEGSSITLTWEQYAMDSINLYYNDGTEHTIATGLTPGDGTYTWNTTGILPGVIDIKLEAIKGTTPSVYTIENVNVNAFDPEKVIFTTSNDDTEIFTIRSLSPTLTLIAGRTKSTNLFSSYGVYYSHVAPGYYRPFYATFNNELNTIENFYITVAISTAIDFPCNNNSIAVNESSSLIFYSYTLLADGNYTIYNTLDTTLTEQHGLSFVNSGWSDTTPLYAPAVAYESVTDEIFITFTGYLHTTSVYGIQTYCFNGDINSQYDNDYDSSGDPQAPVSNCIYDGNIVIAARNTVSGNSKLKVMAKVVNDTGAITTYEESTSDPMIPNDIETDSTNLFIAGGTYTTTGSIGWETDAPTLGNIRKYTSLANITAGTYDEYVMNNVSNNAATIINTIFIDGDYIYAAGSVTNPSGFSTVSADESSGSGQYIALIKLNRSDLSVVWQRVYTSSINTVGTQAGLTVSKNMERLYLTGYVSGDFAGVTHSGTGKEGFIVTIDPATGSLITS